MVGGAAAQACVPTAALSPALMWGFCYPFCVEGNDVLLYKEGGRMRYYLQVTYHQSVLLSAGVTFKYRSPPTF